MECHDAEKTEVALFPEIPVAEPRLPTALSPPASGKSGSVSRAEETQRWCRAGPNARSRDRVARTGRGRPSKYTTPSRRTGSTATAREERHPGTRRPQHIAFRTCCSAGVSKAFPGRGARQGHCDPASIQGCQARGLGHWYMPGLQLDRFQAGKIVRFCLSPGCGCFA